MCDHGDNHGHGGCSHEHSEQPAPSSEFFTYEMHAHIDKDRVAVLNEAIDGSGRFVFKPMDQKSDRTKFVDSDADEELLFNIPFTGHVKLSGLAISGDEGDTHPAKIRLFKDRPAMSFDDCGIAADQEIDLKMDAAGIVDYPLKAIKFNNVSHLSIHIPKNFGADSTRVHYIGLRGEYQQEFKAQAVIATYEARPVPEDHKGEIPGAAGHTIF